MKRSSALKGDTVLSAKLKRRSKPFDRLRINSALLSLTARVPPKSQSRANATRQSSSERATPSITRMNRRKSPPNRPYSTASSIGRASS